MTENAFYSHSKYHFKKFYSGGKYRCPLNFMKNNSKTFRPNNHLWLLQTFFANSKFEMCVNSKKKFLYIAKMFIAKRFYFWGEINRRYLPFKKSVKNFYSHILRITKSWGVIGGLWISQLCIDKVTTKS